MNIPFFRPNIDAAEIDSVVRCLKTGWVTTGPLTKQFERDFAVYVGSPYAVAVNSATAALHIALEAVGLKRGEHVLVPTMTFAATAEVVRYFDAVPVLVDCRESDFNLDVGDALRKVEGLSEAGKSVRAIIPVHYGGQVCDMAGVLRLASQYGLRVVEDAAHCCPAEYRDGQTSPWKKVGSESDVACYSFYANKCITTGEGGMACTQSAEIADRMRMMSLHGISRDAWKRFTSDGSWYYEILAPGFKYNLTDIASALGVEQLKRADAFRSARAQVAEWYADYLSDVEELGLPSGSPDRLHSWHLYVVRVLAGRAKASRNLVIEELKRNGIGTSVHWMPLHLHPYYRENFGYKPEDFPVASRLFPELISLPIYPDLRREQVQFVCNVLKKAVCDQ